MNLDWLAVCLKHQGSGLGNYVMGIVAEEFYHCIQACGLQALTLEAIDQKTEDFYYKLGFRRYVPAVMGRKMILGAKLALEEREKALALEAAKA